MQTFPNSSAFSELLTFRFD